MSYLLPALMGASLRGIQVEIFIIFPYVFPLINSMYKSQFLMCFRLYICFIFSFSRILFSRRQASEVYVFSAMIFCG